MTHPLENFILKKWLRSKRVIISIHFRSLRGTLGLAVTPYVVSTLSLYLQSEDTRTLHRANNQPLPRCTSRLWKDQLLRSCKRQDKQISSLSANWRVSALEMEAHQKERKLVRKTKNVYRIKKPLCDVHLCEVCDRIVSPNQLLLGQFQNSPLHNEQETIYGAGEQVCFEDNEGTLLLLLMLLLIFHKWLNYLLSTFVLATLTAMLFQVSSIVFWNSNPWLLCHICGLAMTQHLYRFNQKKFGNSFRESHWYWL